MSPTRRKPGRTAILYAAAALVALGALVVWLTATRFTSTDDEPNASPASANVCRVAPDEGRHAINAAVSRCPDGSVVMFPARATLHHEDSIEVANRRDLTIDGNGSTFVNTAPNSEKAQPSWKIFKGRNVTLRNMTVVGGFKLEGPRDLGKVAQIASNQFNAGFVVYGGDGVNITDVRVRDVFGDFVTTISSGVIDGSGPGDGEPPRNVRILRLDGTRAARQCIGIAAGIRLWLEDSILRDCWYAGVDAEIDVAGVPLHDVHILRNTIDGVSLPAITVPAPGRTGDVNGIEIRGNRVVSPPDQCWPAVVIMYWHDTGATMANVVTEDNFLMTPMSGVHYRDVSSGSIRNNRIEKVPRCGPAEPISVINSPGVVVE